MNRFALLVALGSGLGGVARVMLGAGMHGWFGPGFPFGVLAANGIGSFAIGLGAAFMAPEGRLLVGPGLRQFFLTGFCGGFTTFSFFSLQTLELLQSGRPAAALIYAVATLAFSLLAVWLGHRFGTRFNQTPPFSKVP